MILKPQDVLVLLKWGSIYPHEWVYITLAVDVGMRPFGCKKALRVKP